MGVDARFLIPGLENADTDALELEIKEAIKDNGAWLKLSDVDYNDWDYSESILSINLAARYRDPSCLHTMDFACDAIINTGNFLLKRFPGYKILYTNDSGGRGVEYTENLLRIIDA